MNSDARFIIGVGFLFILMAFGAGMLIGKDDAGKQELIDRAAEQTELAERLQEQSAGLAQELQVQLNKNDELTEQYSQDSLAWSKIRVRLQATADTAQLEQELIAQQLRAIGDATVDSLLAELEAEFDEERIAYMAQINSLQDERNALWTKDQQSQELIANLQRQAQVQRSVISALEQSNDLLEEAASPGLLNKIKVDAPKYTTGLLLGVIVGAAVSR